MPFTDLADGPEDLLHSPAERAAAGLRSTWVSVAVNLVLTCQHVPQGHRVLNLMAPLEPWRRPDLDHAAPAAPAR